MKTKKGEVYESLVDLDDLDKLLKYKVSWHLFYSKTVKSYYAKCSPYFEGKTTKYMHRWLLDAPSGLYVDHLNHNTLDNRKSNLRIVDNSTNHLNRKGANSNAKSGVRNVHWAERKKKWMVRFWVNGKHLVLGYYDDLSEAAKIANENREKIYGKVM